MAHVMVFGVLKILYIKTTVKTLFVDNSSLLWYNIIMSGVMLSSSRIFGGFIKGFDSVSSPEKRSNEVWRSSDGGQNWVNVHANT